MKLLFSKNFELSMFLLVDLEWAIKLNRISLEVLGLWPKVEKIPREKLTRNLYILAILLLVIFGILLPCIHSLIETHEDIISIIEHLQCILPIITCIIRIVIFWWKKEGIITRIYYIYN